MSANRRSLRIAMLGHKQIPSREGGVEIVVYELATRMAKLSHNVTCFNRGGTHVSGAQYETGGACDGVRLKTVATLDKKGLAAVTSSIAGAVCAAFGKYDVVHFHAEGPSFMCWLPRLFGKKVIVTVHGLDWQRAKWGRFASAYIMGGEKAAVKWAHEIIVLSKAARTYFLDTYNRQTVFIPNGVSRPIPQPAQDITRLGLEKGNYILFLGRIVPEKGIRYLIEAFKQVNTDKKLVIAGGSSDTDEFMEEMQLLAKEDPRIMFIGFVQGRLVEELYSNAYVYTLPSDLEGMPLSLLEAMSYGCCCVTSDIPECVEVVQNKAVTFPKGNMDALCHVLQQLCDEPETVAGYQAEAADYICERYSWDDVVQRTLSLYEV